MRREVPSGPTLTKKESSELAPVKIEGEPGGPTRRTLREPVTEVVDPLRTLDVKYFLPFLFSPVRLGRPSTWHHGALAWTVQAS